MTNDIQKMFDAFGALAKEQAFADKQITTLGELIAKLEHAPQDYHVVLENGAYFNQIASYRGYYSDLALEGGPVAITVNLTVAQLKDCVGKTFEGYKGGDFYMTRRTLMWVSPYGTCSNQMVVGIEVNDEAKTVTIKTELSDDF